MKDRIGWDRLPTRKVAVAVCRIVHFCCMLEVCFVIVLTVQCKVPVSYRAVRTVRMDTIFIS